MAAPPNKEEPSQQNPQLPRKLPPIPKGHIIQKRSLTTRRAPSDSQSHRLYITARTPFRSITTRVRKQLNKSLRTASSTNPQSFTNRLSKQLPPVPLHDRINAIQNSQGSGIGLENTREVIVIGTGRAIEKVVNIAAFFQGQGDVEVRLRTGSVGALDEVVDKGEGEEDDGLGGTGGQEGIRERMVSCLEVGFRLK
ncbi:Rpp20 subunit of nuclear RNase MRP and P-domain-containing protein [Xylariales sp. AK1849]|nr:Rpp20 subunit of nuclear RNase MRP and P-domain-containing protein [Xylariales sp. AK1849]